MILKINPTRINLLTLKRNLKVALRGHKLLKDKRDGLMRAFLTAVQDAKKIREEVNQGAHDLLKSYRRASITMSPKARHGAFLLPSIEAAIEVTTKNIMSVPIQSLSLSMNGNPFSYSFLETSGELDRSVMSFFSFMPKLIKLAELEASLSELADEIERTRRRASALENTMIPNLKDTIRFIGNRLEEQARDAVVSSMRIKAMITEREESSF